MCAYEGGCDSRRPGSKFERRGYALAREAENHHVSLSKGRFCGDLDGKLLLIIHYDVASEPEAAAIHASSLSTLHNLRPTQSFIICDAGGGTVDSAVYRIMGQLSQLEIAEVAVRSGSNCGSLFVDVKFEELLRKM